VALAFFMIVGAALFAKTLAKLEQTDTGFEKERVLMLRLDSDPSNAKGPALLNLFRRLDVRIRALPGVEAASFSEVTFNEGHWRADVRRQGAPQTEANAKSIDGDHVGAQYFKVLGVPVIAGRGFGPQDTLQSQPVAVVNETFARTMYPNESALGRHFMLTAHDDFEIVGVVKDAKYESIREKPTATFFLSNDQDRDPDGFSDLVIRTRQKPESTIGEIRAAIHDENPNLAISNVMTLAEAVDRSLTEARLLAKLAGFFGALALLLAAIGLYGVIAYSVAGRTNEIGIRMALGARPISIVVDVLREFLFVVALGLAIGLPMALACGRLAASQLYGVTPGDPWLIAGAAAVLIVTALAAGFLPARRAAVLDPLLALREE
jgi:predicted permease